MPIYVSITEQGEIDMSSDNYLPQKAFFTLKEACSLKNLNYKTACNKKCLQPPGAVHVGGKRVYSRKDIIQWLKLPNELISFTNEENTHA